MKNKLFIKSATAFMVTATIAGAALSTPVFASDYSGDTSFNDSSEEYMTEENSDEFCYSGESEYVDIEDTQCSDDEYFEDTCDENDSDNLDDIQYTEQNEDWDDIQNNEQNESVEDTQNNEQNESEDDTQNNEQNESEDTAFNCNEFQDDACSDDDNQNCENDDCIDEDADDNEFLDSEDIDYNNYEFDFTSGNIEFEYDIEECYDDCDNNDFSDDECIDIDDDCSIEAVKSKERGPAIDMHFYNSFLGYHGTRVDYKNLEEGKFYLMQIPKKGKIPTFKFCVVKITGSYTNKGIICDDVMVTFDKFNEAGKLVARNRKTQVNENIFNMTPNHFYELTDDILAK